jgi:hypothetical protein
MIAPHLFGLIFCRLFFFFIAGVSGQLCDPLVMSPAEGKRSQKIFKNFLRVEGHNIPGRYSPPIVYL